MIWIHGPIQTMGSKMTPQLQLCVVIQESKHSQAVITDVLLLTVVVGPFLQQLYSRRLLHTHGDIVVLTFLPGLTIIHCLWCVAPSWYIYTCTCSVCEHAHVYKNASNWAFVLFPFIFLSLPVSLSLPFSPLIHF